MTGPTVFKDLELLRKSPKISSEVHGKDLPRNPSNRAGALRAESVVVPVPAGRCGSGAGRSGAQVELKNGGGAKLFKADGETGGFCGLQKGETGEAFLEI